MTQNAAPVENGKEEYTLHEYLNDLAEARGGEWVAWALLLACSKLAVAVAADDEVSKARSQVLVGAVALNLANFLRVSKTEKFKEVLIHDSDQIASFFLPDENDVEEPELEQPISFASPSSSVH